MREFRNKLLTKEMTRKQFLQFMAGALVAFLGMSNFLSFLSKHSEHPNKSVVNDSSHGFGSRKFGA
jgi:hypothetical protein